ncbi:DUF11 domain-containing protein [Deinococcus multiflagellatus]|uniref:DUF11 domain-containing protein n=1 Tax=Deinococcus multiflagellatus TaxID=1656887 RepID=A0ABW1ZLH3_9DEIO|nr:DUF11 domain-containing protein [Deinococcus multiflagellatus]MBZ9713411.1 DUF11 domain-containing protein [Deinococcus multiflagellatus]
MRNNPSVLNTLAALALTLLSPAQAAGTPAGTVIENQATLEFTPEGGPPTSIPTPPVTTVVQPICAVSVVPSGTVAQPGQSLSLLPGEGATLRYTLTNAGNATNTVSLRAAVEAASQFTPGGLGIRTDSNGNGQLDDGDAAVQSVTLAADASATLFVPATTQSSNRGDAFVNLIASCATNTSGRPGETDDDNVGRIRLSEPPELTLTKTFRTTKSSTVQSLPSSAPQAQATPNATELRPGQETEVTLTARNIGAGASRPVTVSDFLNTPDMRDFVFISGSARVQGSGVLEYSADGTAWTGTETTPVAAIRVRTESLGPGETLTLTFRLRAPQDVTGTRRNVGLLRSGDIAVDAPADVTLRYTPAIALGPIGNPQALPGGELSEDDKQTKQVALIGQEVCFPHTVQNLGDRPDTITVTGRAVRGQATIRFTERDGTPITEPFRVPDLAPQATKDFNACYLIRSGNISSALEDLRIELRAQSSRGAPDNLTIDVVLSVAQNLLSPVKTGSAGSGLVAPGQEITYTLSFTNAQNFALNNVVIRDNLRNLRILDAGGNLIRTDALEFISADQGGVLEGDTVVWRFARLNPGEAVTLTLRARVPQSTPDGALVVNTFTVTSAEVPEPTESNPVQNGVFNQANLTMVKTSSPEQVAYGQTITYTFTVTNRSTTAALQTIRVQDTLPAGLVYIEGSSRLNGTPIVPAVSGRTYVWEIPGLAPGASAVITFDAEVTPEAGTQIRNSAIATAISNNGQTQTPISSAVNRIDPLIFGRNTADVVGYVFLDTNRNGIYDRGTDIPYQNARVVLAGGRIALTDAQGRYHFRNLVEGTQALRLDPNSVWAQNLSVPQDAGRPGSRLVYVRNLTSVDFPLAPDYGEIAVIRDTTLRVAAGLPLQTPQTLTIRKQVFAGEVAGEYRVQLILSSSADLNAVRIDDPLPAGAELIDGQNVLTYDILPGGERAVTYRFRWTGDPKGAVTDPTASWRY